MKPSRILPLMMLAFVLIPAVHAAAIPSEVELRSRTFTPAPGLDALDRAGADGAETRHLLVQLDAFPDEAARADLEVRGVRLLDYIPRNTWIAAFDPSAFEDPEIRKRLVWAGEILPTDKMPLRWQTGLFGDWAFQPDGRLEMRVRFHQDVDPASVAPVIERLGGEIVSPMSIFPGYTIHAPAALGPEIAALEPVLWISEGNPEPVLHNDQNRVITNAELLQLPPYGLTGSMVFVGIWDGGLVDPNHDDFDGRLIHGEGGGVSSHATHVAGTVGGSGIRSQANGGQPLQWRGMAPEAILFSWNFYGDVPQEIIDGVWTYELDLETNSWSWGVNGGNCWLYGDYDNWAPEFDAITTGAGGRQLNVIFSAANERDDGDCPLLEGEYACIPPPGTAKNVITVGATNSDDDTMTGFSSYGPVDDGRLKPDVTAPGCQRYGEGAVRSCEPGNIYSLKCGTSMAAPTVTGCLALLTQLYNEENMGADPDPTILKALIIATGEDLGNPGPDYAFGHGRIDVKRAADAMLHDSQVTLPVGHGDTQFVYFPVPAGTGEIRLALVWHDPPGSPLADPALVNDLDLALIDPQGTVHYPWILDPEHPSQNATRGEDHINNVEHVLVENPAAGIWRARISGTNVPEGPQVASLVGFDHKAPGAPIDFRVEAEEETGISLLWTNAAAGDRKGTILARWEGISLWLGPAPGETYTVGEMVAPGVEILYVGDEDHSADPFVDDDVVPGRTYKYAAYTFDDMHNYSIAANAEGTAGEPAAAGEAGALEELALHPARPNPAESQTQFSFSLQSAAFVKVSLYDAAGRRVRTLLDAAMSPGSYTATWDGRDDAGRPVAPGVYYYELRAGGERLSKSLSWMR